MVGVRQHLSLLGPILPALTALWKCQFTSHFQNLFPGSLAISLGNDLVSCTAASAWTDRQTISQQCWSPDRNAVRVLSLQDAALHSCLHRKQISNISILLTPICLSIVALYPLPPGPYLAICYCSYAGCLLLEMNNCCHHRLSTEPVSVLWLQDKVSSFAAARRKKDVTCKLIENMAEVYPASCCQCPPQSRGPETKSCHLFCPTTFPLEAVSCTGLAVFKMGSRKEWG